MFLIGIMQAHEPFKRTGKLASTVTSEKDSREATPLRARATFEKTLQQLTSLGATV